MPYRSPIPKPIYQAIVGALLIFSVAVVVWWWSTETGPVPWIIGFGFSKHQAGILAWLMTFVIWLVIAVLLRMMTDFGEPLVATKQQWLQRWKEELAKPRTLPQEQLRLAFGGLLLALL